MEEVKNRLQDDLIVRWFIRFLTGSLMIYFSYYIIKNNEDGGLDLTSDAWFVIIGSLATWAAWEIVRPILKKIIEKYAK